MSSHCNPEHTAADGSDRVGDSHACQAAAIIEHTVADGGDRVGDCKIACQSTAAFEGTAADGGDRVGDGHASHATAVTERIGADGGDGVGLAVVGDCTGDSHVT